ncbi:hypothetical protein L226DRAFT_524868 [Lentinus tigrinus ALCF2SS1-7]|uniref:F-box domain-containing protein n=1 Tax=Lentinus tigrinus ALCF2SS1-6 TaxID=1328759 RepID=A0A5C2S3D5_9APHY|nr:hypothetical protein L227DRAFT_613089 [Lentinus tigrinus ALCF2SS1-6]RPD72310.1 hypothetical protein L226DRAFT_524868 [Lentinus tigrinus ALCF2SS1-7]
MSCPSLGELKLRFLRSSLPLQTVAAGLKNLRTLELPDSVGIADEGALQALAALPQLYALHDLHLKLPSRRTTPTLSVSGFRSLKELSVVGDASNVSRFLPCVMSALDKFEIMSFGLLSPWLPAYPAISSNLLYVRELVIRHAPRRPSARRGEEDVSEIELVELLQPLLQLRNVESFCLALRTVGLVGDDDMFETVAQAWPRLTLFWLDAEPFLSTPTFLTLSAFAMHCPSLRTLVLPHVDHAALQFIMYGFKAEKPQTALRRLSFCLAGGLRVDDARSAAKLVVGIFPMLDVLASAVLPQRVHMFSDESQADPTAQLKEAHRQDGAILWAMVLEEVQKLQLGETP